jgi:hypothetical protein
MDLRLTISSNRDIRFQLHRPITNLSTLLPHVLLSNVEHITERDICTKGCILYFSSYLSICTYISEALLSTRKISKGFSSRAILATRDPNFSVHLP